MGNRQLSSNFQSHQKAQKHKLLYEPLAFGFKVFVYQDDSNNDTPDSIYPNNWITFHNDNFRILSLTPTVITVCISGNVYKLYY